MARASSFCPARNSARDLGARPARELVAAMIRFLARCLNAVGIITFWSFMIAWNFFGFGYELVSWEDARRPVRWISIAFGATIIFSLGHAGWTAFIQPALSPAAANIVMAAFGIALVIDIVRELAGRIRAELRLRDLMRRNDMHEDA
jgi:hypothetical protein